MVKKFSREQFRRLAEELWREGPEVRYENPDAWINHLLKKMQQEEENKKKQYK